MGLSVATIVGEMSGKGTVLIADDEPDLRRALRFAFEHEGYRVLTVSSAEQGLKLVARRRPDVVILDVGFPGMDGYEFCRRLRQTDGTPILFLTARKSETERVLGLRLGGDDYLTKPFSTPELLARVHALLRRARPEETARDLLRAGEITIDVSRHAALVQGRPIALSPKEFDCLKVLAQANGRIVARRAFLTRVWGVGKDIELATRTVDQHVARLRRKLGPEGGRLLTIPRVGYQLTRA
ncbi:MAG: response regulator transcription factor [Elusimicrobia bacterium]|nr:response regulator transcription factor [Elusimicrobiota bacterium]